ncbi:MAG: EF2563 family selenium-dependent molybdenum hydroxylase system protein [Proteobacteria bacterium]|nr:EF2563 family selenium-dependent molybdenum hydroxylase system protein [Pseudomonadota bacterium]
MRLVAVVLAAGSATRMGTDKLTLPFGGSTVLECAVEPLLHVTQLTEVVLVVRPGFSVPESLRQRVRIVENQAHHRGMGASLRAGVEASVADGWVISLGDLPCLDQTTIEAVIEELTLGQKGIIVPHFRGQRGHPVVISARYKAELLGLDHDVGAKKIIERHAADVCLLAVDGPSLVLDIDTPADLGRHIKGKEAKPKILVKGAGEQASATAWRLFRCGFPVVMTELAHPSAVRRTVSFCSAIPNGEAEVEGVRGRGYDLSESAVLADLDQSHLPVFVDPAGEIRRIWRPDVIIDGRILKYNLDNSMGHAPLTIGLGPGLVAGKDVHFVVETNRGHDLARIISSGTAAPDTGVPGDIGGRSRERVLRASIAGILETHAKIGDLVQVGEEVATIGDNTLRAQLSGMVRGILPTGSLVRSGQKVGDIDPRGKRHYCYTISDKARAICGSVLEIVVSWRGAP